MSWIAPAVAAFLAGAIAGAAWAFRRSEGGRRTMLDEFRSAAQNALREVKKDGAGELDAKRDLIQQSVQDMKDRLAHTEKKISDFQDERKKLEGQLVESVKTVLGAAQTVSRETASLKQAMVSGTGVRGSFGQMTLETILEENGLQKGIHYRTQVSKEGSIPDFVVNLPGENRLAIDAKEVAAEFLLAQDCEDEEKRKAHYLQLAKNIKTNFVNLSSRAYQENIDGSLPFVVMFVSNEAAMRAALSADPTLFEEARRRKIYLASPMTIVPMIQLVRLTLQQQTLAENAEELGRDVEELGARLNTFVGHLQKLGKAIGASVESWDAAVGSWGRMVAPQMDRVREHGGKLDTSKTLDAVGKSPRLIEKTVPALPE